MVELCGKKLVSPLFRIKMKNYGNEDKEQRMAKTSRAAGRGF